MDVSEDLLTVYTATVEHENGRFVLDVPNREVDAGVVRDGGVYRVAVLSTADTEQPNSDTSPPTESKPAPVALADKPAPPVEIGEQRTVTIEDIGSKGDGVARVERGYVVIVPDTSVGDEVAVKITEVRDSVGFATVIDT